MANERAIFQARNFSSTIGQLLQDIHLEAAPPKPKPKAKPKNYARENHKRLKEIQEKCKQKEEEKLKLSQRKVGTNKYKNVKSKVFTVTGKTNDNELQKTNDERNSVLSNKPSTCESSLSLLPLSASQCGDVNNSKSPSPKPDLDENELNKLRDNDEPDIINKNKELSNSSEEIQPDITNQNVTSVEVSEDSEQGNKCNNINLNQQLSDISQTKNENNNNISSKSVISTARSEKSNTSDVRSVKSSKGKETKIHQLGEIPKYLIQRQYDLKEQELKQKQEEKDPSIPPGHMILSQEERLSTLEKFKKNKDELLREYIHLPVCCDTLRARKRKETLEQELAKMDEGIEIFSKHRVLIKIDD